MFTDNDRFWRVPQAVAAMIVFSLSILAVAHYLFPDTSMEYLAGILFGFAVMFGSGYMALIWMHVFLNSWRQTTDNRMPLLLDSKMQLWAIGRSIVHLPISGESRQPLTIEGGENGPVILKERRPEWQHVAPPFQTEQPEVIPHEEYERLFGAAHRT